MDARGCKVIAGRWEGPYTGLVFTDPRRLDIDHLVPLAEVHRSGGDRWTAEQRRDYANDLSDPDTLVAVSRSANRTKGARDPARWMPRNAAHHCDYVEAWVAVKERWGLSMDADEQTAIRGIEEKC